MTPKKLASAKRRGRLPDVYILGGETDVDFDDPELAALLNVDSSGLDDAARREVDAEEGVVALP